jgi:putative transposase
MNRKQASSLSRKDKEKRRLKAGKLFEKGLTRAEVSRKLKATVTAACDWHETWKKHGLEGLKSKGHPGFESSFTDEDRGKLKNALLKGACANGFANDLWTLPRIGKTIKKLTGKSFGHTWVWQIVLSLGFTRQKPQTKNKERNEKAIKEWRLKTFPELKKMGSNSRISAWV